MPYGKYAKKAYRSAKKAIKKRYGFNKKSKSVKFVKMAKDIMMLKEMVNAEKKSFSLKDATSLSCGQVYGNLTGTVCYDITPLILAGSAADQRTGNSVNLHSALYQFQLQQQSSATLANKVIIEFWVNKGTQLNTSDAREYLFAPATFSGVIDYNSPRNQDRFSDFQLIRRVIKTTPTDSLSGEQTVNTFDVPVKFNRGKGHHIRLAGSIAGNPLLDVLNGQMFMTMRSAIGNNSLVASTLNVPITAASSGISVRFAYKCWYYDN